MRILALALAASILGGCIHISAGGGPGGLVRIDGPIQANVSSSGPAGAARPGEAVAVEVWPLFGLRVYQVTPAPQAPAAPPAPAVPAEPAEPAEPAPSD